jgi:hypothetical protein
MTQRLAFDDVITKRIREERHKNFATFVNFCSNSPLLPAASLRRAN